jgi:hypothetical protein
MSPLFTIQLLPNITSLLAGYSLEYHQLSLPRYIPGHLPSWLIFQHFPAGEIPMYEYGCVFDGQVNCSKTGFHNPALLWRDPMTLQNCLLYPIVSTLLAADRLDSHGIATAKKFDIVDGGDIELSELTKPINECAAEFREQTDATSFFTPLSYNTTRHIELLYSVAGCKSLASPHGLKGTSLNYQIVWLTSRSLLSLRYSKAGIGCPCGTHYIQLQCT